MAHDATIYEPTYTNSPAETADEVAAAIAASRASYASSVDATEEQFRWAGSSSPVIGTYSPASAVANVATPPLQITLNGSGFSAGDVVVWGGTDTAATLLSSTQLRITVATRATAGGVNAYVRTTGGKTSNTKLFNFTASARAVEESKGKRDKR